MLRAALLVALCCTAARAYASELTDKYNAQHPLVIVGDWDKPPYEFLNDRGEPSGTNIDLMRMLCKELGIPCQFMLKEWSGALKTFERGDADIILANVKRYRSKEYVCSDNTINYNRICVATLAKDSAGLIKTSELLRKGVVLKYGDYTGVFMSGIDSLAMDKVEYQSPKAALQGLLTGDYRYFCWGEEPLKWKISKLHLEDIAVCDAEIPVSEIHIVGRDANLIYRLDDIYSRMKQSGEVQRINDSWMHPERVKENVSPHWLYYLLGVLMVAALLYIFARLARLHVKKATRSSTEIKEMMFKALKMGNFHIMEYDIKRNLMVNRYGSPILPQEGITLEEFIKHIHPKEREEFTRKMESLISGRESKFVLKKRWRTFQEGEHWLYLDGHAMVETDSDGHPAVIVNAIHDMTSDEQTVREIYEIGRKYETLSQTPMLAISFYDKDGWLLDINDRMKEICDMTPDNPDAQRFWTTVCLFDIPLFRNIYKPASREPIQACMYMKYSDIYIDRCVEFHVQPLFDANDEVANYYVTTIDLTGERAMHRRLMLLKHEKDDTAARIRQQKGWLEYLLLNSDRYLLRYDTERRELSLYRKPDKPEYVQQIDRFCTDCLKEADAETFRKMICDQKEQDTQQCVIHLKKGLEGQTGTVFLEKFWPVRDDGGRIVGHEGISTDISAIVQARQQLDDITVQSGNSVRLKSGFMASMTHELRTPLNAIIGFTGVLDPQQEPADRAEYVRIIQNGSDMMQRLLNDITQASSIIDGPTSFQYAEVDFARAFDDICFTLQHRVQTPAVSFIKENGYKSLVVTIDIGRVQQVITNFVTNAVKFTAKGHIRLGYRYEREGIYAFCEDTGIGIPKDKQDVIFERFVKLDDFVQGTGMGLAICKSIVEHMGGEIGVESPEMGKGSTFWFWIPCKKVQAP